MGTGLMSLYCIDNQQTSPTYTPALTLEKIPSGRGGYINISVADVYCQVETDIDGQGDPQWGTEIHVPIGTAHIIGKSTGVRFRSYTPGFPATVSAGIFLGTLPQFILGQSGIA
jgi:hypothetical protein